jgi:hypothetical protein
MPPAKPRVSRASPNPTRKVPPSAPETIDPIWLLRAIAVALLAALLCGYATLCLLFYQGQWQLILHPVRTSYIPPYASSDPITLLHFAPDDSGIPQVTGWLLKAPADARYGGFTVLLLPGGDGSLAGLSDLGDLHEVLGANLFAIDYRGYGQSAEIHPNQRSMTKDADAAWRYLTATRGVPESRIIPYGVGLGASLATHLAVEHRAAPALILDSPASDPLQTALRDPRARWLPVRALFRERFPLAVPLATLTTPKLLLSTGAMDPAFATAADPKMTIEVPDHPDAGRLQNTRVHDSILDFLDQYLPPQPAAIQ